MNIIKTLKSNWRDLVAFVLIGLGFACVGGILDYVSNWGKDGGFLALVLPTLSNYIQGFSKFIGASLTATFVWMLLWPKVSNSANTTFNDTFETLSAEKRLVIYLALVAVALIAAAICFS